MTASNKESSRVEYLNPDGLHRNPAFTQVIVTSGPSRTIYIGGQNAIDATGAIVGSEIKTQAEQVFRNLQVALTAAGAQLEHIIKWTIYVVAGQPVQPAFEVFQQVWGERPNPPTISMLFVAGLAHPEFLLEIDAIAVVPTAGD